MFFKEQHDFSVGMESKIMLRSEKEYREIWKHYGEKVGSILPEMLNLSPDFLVISPAKTCSTWLYDNMILHPDVYIKFKEINYFSAFWQWYDINWYLGQFAGGDLKCKGDVSGTYSLLPLEGIQYIHSLFPELKLVIVLRNPAERAWSQIRHYYRFKVGPFKNYKGLLEDIELLELIDKYWVDSYYLWSDYPSIIKRWLSVFPSESMFVSFTDSIAKNPKQVINDLFSFLNLNTSIDYSSFPLDKLILKGLEIDIPTESGNFLHSIFKNVLKETGILLEDKFGMALPAEWNEKEFGQISSELQIREGYLLPNRDEDQNALPRFMESFGEYNILFYEGQFHAISQRSGEIDLHMLTENEKNKMLSSLDYRVCETPDGLKTEIENICLAKS